GFAVHDPVICADGLVGVVTSVASGASTVNLINDSSARAAVVDNRNDELGIVQADPGDPTLLQMIDVPDVTTLHVGDLIVTAGQAVTHNGTLFPPNVPVGIVKSLPAAGDDTGTVT